MGAISCLQTGGPNEMITNLGVGLEAQQDMGGGLQEGNSSICSGTSAKAASEFWLPPG